MNDTTPKFKTRKEAQAAAKAARARVEEVREAANAAEAAMEAAQKELREAVSAAHEAENEAAAVPNGSIVYVPIQFHSGSAQYGTWIKAGHYDAWTDEDDVRVRVGAFGCRVPRGRYRVVWTPWMGTPRPDPPIREHVYGNESPSCVVCGGELGFDVGPECPGSSAGSRFDDYLMGVTNDPDLVYLRLSPVLRELDRVVQELGGRLEIEVVWTEGGA